MVQTARAKAQNVGSRAKTKAKPAAGKQRPKFAEETATSVKQTAKVFMTGRSQAVRIPAEFRFSSKEVFIRKDELTGEVILTPRLSWKEIFAGLDAAGVPDDFLTPEDRNQGVSQVREWM